MTGAAFGKHILVLAPNWIGDGVMCTPALRALRRRYPNARLTVAARAGVCAVLEDLTWIDCLLPIPEKPSFFRMVQVAQQLRPYGRDIVVVFPHSFRAALLAWLVQGRQRIGQARNGRAVFFTQSRIPDKENGAVVPVYMVREYLDLVELVGCEDDNQGPELGVSETATRYINAQLNGKRPLIGIAPGAAFGPSKRWMPEAFAATADIIASRRHASFVLLTGPGEEYLRDALPTYTNVKFITVDTGDMGLAALKAVIAQLDLLIGNDSGPRHIAVAFKRPVVCVMGPTSPSYTEGPYEHGVRLQAKLPCVPCQQPVCPLGHHQCMRDITPEQVAAAALDCLEKAETASENDVQAQGIST